MRAAPGRASSLLAVKGRRGMGGGLLLHSQEIGANIRVVENTGSAAGMDYFSGGKYVPTIRSGKRQSGVLLYEKHRDSVASKGVDARDDLLLIPW